MTALGRAAALLLPEPRDRIASGRVLNGLDPREADQHSPPPGTPEAAYLDLLGPDEEPASTGRTQDLMLGRAVPFVYERWWRPAWGRVATGLGGPSPREEHAIARELLELAPGDAVLDVACGPGNFTRPFGEAVGSTGLAIGLDASATMLERASADTPERVRARVGFVRGDATRLPFRDESFDAVCCFLALHLMEDPVAALREMARVLTPGGRLALFTTRRLRTPPFAALSALGGRRAGMYVFAPGELEATLTGLGLTDLRVWPTGVTQYVGARRPR